MKKWLQVLMMLAATAALAVLAKHYEFPDIQVNHVEEVIIPGVEGEYEFLFLADLHLIIKSREDLGGLGDADARIAGFANYFGTPSSEQLKQWIAYANQEQFDAVLMGGDMIDYYSDENAAYLAEQIRGLEMPYLYALGNHEWHFPWEDVDRDEAMMQEDGLSSLFQNHNSAFQVLEYEEFAICAIDNEAYQVHEESLVALQNWIEEHPEKPIILVAHVPFWTEMDQSLLEKSVNAWGSPIVIGTGEGMLDTSEDTRTFLELLQAEDCPVVAIFTGDNHFYHKGNLTGTMAQWVADPAYLGDGMKIIVKGN